MRLNSIITAFVLGSSGMAFAEPYAPYYHSLPYASGVRYRGVDKAEANCDATIDKQNVNGQTGSQTGNANDPKYIITGVTECDHFWQAIGAIGYVN